MGGHSEDHHLRAAEHTLCSPTATEPGSPAFIDLLLAATNDTEEPEVLVQEDLCPICESIGLDSPQKECLDEEQELRAWEDEQDRLRAEHLAAQQPAAPAAQPVMAEAARSYFAGTWREPSRWPAETVALASWSGKSTSGRSTSPGRHHWATAPVFPATAHVHMHRRFAPAHQGTTFQHPGTLHPTWATPTARPFY